MSPWHEVVLIIFSCASLITALYCLFFMVPVKRFWERIDSLGGGVKGVEAYVDGVHDEVRRKLSEMESSVRHQISQARESSNEAVARLAKDSRQARRDMERFRGDLQSLQAELRTAAADSGKLGQAVESLSNRLHQIQDDLDGLDVKLRESVRQLVAESFKSVESTVLSALDAIQEEMIALGPRPHATPAPFGPHRPSRPQAGTDRNGRSDPHAIIEPLFAGIQNREDDKGDKGAPGSEPPEEGTEQGEDEPGEGN